MDKNRERQWKLNNNKNKDIEKVKTEEHKNTSQPKQSTQSPSSSSFSKLSNSKRQSVPPYVRSSFFHQPTVKILRKKYNDTHTTFVPSLVFTGQSLGHYDFLSNNVILMIFFNFLKKKKIKNVFIWQRLVFCFFFLVHT